MEQNAGAVYWQEWSKSEEFFSSSPQQYTIECFRRYRRAKAEWCKISWGNDVIKQWEKDRAFWAEAYEEAKDAGNSFEQSREIASERLFMRCLGWSEKQ